jgi:hypothetical protein
MDGTLSSYVLQRPSELRPCPARVASGPCTWSQVFLYLKTRRGAQGLERLDQDFSGPVPSIFAVVYSHVIHNLLTLFETGDGKGEHV